MTRPLYEANAEFFRTLGHPAQIQVLELLSEGDYAVHELLQQIEIGASNLSHQLAVLRRNRLIEQGRSEGGLRGTATGLGLGLGTLVRHGCRSRPNTPKPKPMLGIRSNHGESDAHLYPHW